jgi:hypothetical protein
MGMDPHSVMGLSFVIICVLSIMSFVPIILLGQISAKSRG